MILDIKDLSFGYNEKTILKNLNFQVNKGELVAIIGPNGAGKTTFFKCLLNFVDTYSGSIIIDGTQTKVMERKTLATNMAYVPQLYVPVFGYTVLEMVLMGTSRNLNFFQQPNEKHIQSAENALNMVNALALKDNDFTKLSGGQQQLVLIARAIAQNAKILILDEPTSSLDYGNQIRILKLIKKLTQNGFTILFSTHNPADAIDYADKVLVMSDIGETICGKPGCIINEELINKIYALDEREI